ncbi:HIT family protein [Corynebacterium pseudodiphtheriticum]|uniref:HIT family protein n=1 Tax=Corynebacterium pseudodiphtheriticum TaxID=37637 RepID=UPI0020BEB8AE|nr:HIT family protein [Corynebacterium pseudodiphtheriticum]MDC7089422.1 HIT family protein [Corynebacterium pseudodiphtheriticum]MDC7110655.1 HIT family protein [Corynebacterium pseudodiphtheriticum]MDC7114703.1 HIT family protein [Corynebacterium pseudodiphtheriticum]MDK8487312.1 HIT family protein [Corynebacterium pseudodiphtheriticum]MDK8494508.1 HIT family protein [Corynebacterium pseudodiphtheriticum]
MSTVFSKVINGDLPGRFVYRSSDVVAFLSIEPLAYGHVLVVPVEEVDKWTDMAPELWARVNAVAYEIGNAVIQAFDAPRAGNVIAGFEVPHAHIHVFPARSMDDFNFANVIPADQTDEAAMDEAAQKLRAALGTNEDGTKI